MGARELAAAIMLTFESILPSAAAAQAENFGCPPNTVSTIFTLRHGEECPGNKFGKMCDTCENKRGDYVPFVTNDAKERKARERLLKKIKKGIAQKPKKGVKYTREQIASMRAVLSGWSPEDVERFVVERNGNLTEEQRKFYRGALLNWPALKLEAIDMKEDPRFIYLLALVESRFLAEKGGSGEVSILQIMPKTMQEMFDKYGYKDSYIKNLVKNGKKWKTDKRAQWRLAIYYWKDARTVADCPDNFNDATEQHLSNSYAGYNRGISNANPETAFFEFRKWWQGRNFAECIASYLKDYPFIEEFIAKFIDTHVTTKEATLVADAQDEGAEKRLPLAAVKEVKKAAKDIVKVAKRQETLAHMEIERRDKAAAGIAAKAVRGQQLTTRDYHALTSHMTAKVDAQKALEAAQIVRATMTVVAKAAAVLLVAPVNPTPSRGRDEKPQLIAQQTEEIQSAPKGPSVSAGGKKDAVGSPEAPSDPLQRIAWKLANQERRMAQIQRDIGRLKGASR